MIYFLSAIFAIIFIFGVIAFHLENLRVMHRWDAALKKSQPKF